VGRVLTQDQILEALWPETYVNPEVPRKNIQEIRKALGDLPDKPEFIETLPKGEGAFCESRRFGYRSEVHPKIHSIRNELRVRLSLVAAHNAVCHAFRATRQPRSASSSVGAHYESI
jgi:hypothetical protein